MVERAEKNAAQDALRALKGKYLEASGKLSMRGAVGAPRPCIFRACLPPPIFLIPDLLDCPPARIARGSVIIPRRHMLLLTAASQRASSTTGQWNTQRQSQAKESRCAKRSGLRLYTIRAMPVCGCKWKHCWRRGSTWICFCLLFGSSCAQTCTMHAFATGPPAVSST